MILTHLLTNTTKVYLSAHMLDGTCIYPKINILTYWLIMKLYWINRANAAFIDLIRKTWSESDVVGGSMQFNIRLCLPVTTNKRARRRRNAARCSHSHVVQLAHLAVASV